MALDADWLKFLFETVRESDDVVPFYLARGRPTLGAFVPVLLQQLRFLFAGKRDALFTIADKVEENLRANIGQAFPSILESNIQVLQPGVNVGVVVRDRVDVAATLGIVYRTVHLVYERLCLEPISHDQEWALVLL